jgi:hypothetical protein
MFGSGSPFVRSLSGVWFAEVEEGRKETLTDVGEMVDAGKGV